ncbi:MULTISPECIES: DUF3310 domain-containing protein [Gammaproteobacteria]|nr:MULTISPECIES: DUF3310 domain-containing protein [Gammaproteobacteria]MBH0013665.1 DUF3310 domain-containing protein [Pseudoalteromonas sp. NZS100_1]MBH0052186.1 DUF3310 domain-containing protein [Pseudoalteromonas sp. SWYJZ19]MBQ5557917.1 DUF3310 domain-containing protein [Aeriscardovia sp.]MBQ9003005.1 DUF3310 domain-containing protein [Eggerthellaceae bacterium]
MVGVNGIEIKVGQVWRCRDGKERKVVSNDGHDDWPWDLENGDSVSDTGAEFYDGESNSDLIELVKDENGFTIWRGGEQPAETRGKVVEVRIGRSTKHGPADRYMWNHCGNADIAAYKVAEKAAAPQPSDSATLAEETLSALGWTFDGQAWTEQPKAELPIGMVPNALDVQVGGTHYKDCAIQPIEYIHANKLGFAEGNVVKYITRHRQKHGADDVRKVIHYCQLLLELEYGAGKTEGGV